MQAVQVLSCCHFREKKSRQLFNETTSKPLNLPPSWQLPSYSVRHSVCYHTKVSGSSTTAWSKLMFFALIRAALAIAMYSLYFRFNWLAAISSSLLTEKLSFSSFRSLPSSKGRKSDSALHDSWRKVLTMSLQVFEYSEASCNTSQRTSQTELHLTDWSKLWLPPVSYYQKWRAPRTYSGLHLASAFALLCQRFFVRLFYCWDDIT